MWSVFSFKMLLLPLKRRCLLGNPRMSVTVLLGRAGAAARPLLSYSWAVPSYSCSVLVWPIFLRRPEHGLILGFDPLWSLLGGSAALSLCFFLSSLTYVRTLSTVPQWEPPGGCPQAYLEVELGTLEASRSKSPLVLSHHHCGSVRCKWLFLSPHPKVISFWFQWCLNYPSSLRKDLSESGP